MLKFYASHSFHSNRFFLYAIACTERDLGVEGCCAEEQVVERLVAIVTPAGRRKSLDTSISNPDTAEKRKANVDDTLEMARYFW